MKGPKQANPQRRKVDSWLPGAREWLLMGTRFPFGMTKCFWNWLWWWLHSSVNTHKPFNCILETGELHRAWITSPQGCIKNNWGPVPLSTDHVPYIGQRQDLNSGPSGQSSSPPALLPPVDVCLWVSSNSGLAHHQSSSPTCYSMHGTRVWSTCERRRSQPQELRGTVLKGSLKITESASHLLETLSLYPQWDHPASHEVSPPPHLPPRCFV